MNKEREILSKRICPTGYRPLTNRDIIQENDLFTNDEGKTFRKACSIGHGYESYFYPMFRINKTIKKII
jgi:hypothetical protein